ncbi:MAG: TonB-dependent receptor, partial [Bryobacterales bacterium]|nr:TonB-dependent receptor [Bryobacterales bacterium]
GFEYRRTGMNRLAANYPGGRIGFSALESGHAFASLLLGYANYAETPEGLPLTQPRSNMFSLYVLDDWKITPKLTANIGLRFDHFGEPYDAGGYWRSFDFDRTFRTSGGQTIPTLYPASLGDSAAVPLWSHNEKLIMPRVGLAWRPANKWVLRAGSGWYSSTPHFNNFTILNLMPPYSGSRQFNSVTDAAQTVPVSAAGQQFNVTTRRFRPGTQPLQLGPGLFAGEARINPENLWYVEKNRKNHNHWTWSFDMQRELPLGTALTVGYVGSKSSSLTGIIQNWNTAPPSPDTNFQARRPVQYFHDPLRPQVEVRTVAHLQAIVNGMNSFYHGATVSLDKRYSKGLAYGVYYVFSKANGESSGSQDGVPVQNPRNYREGRGPLGFDRRHVIVGNFVYELPWLKAARGVSGLVLGGWQVNGMIAFRSGFPYTMTQGDDLNTGGFTSVRPDRIGDGHLDNPSRKLWFDPSAFRRVTCNIPNRQELCHYGNSGVGILNGPMQKNTDLSLFKNFSIAKLEPLNLQLRLEAFNALNTPFFGNPASVGFASVNSTVPDAPRMGEIRSLEAPMRTIQLGIKLTW